MHHDALVRKTVWTASSPFQPCRSVACALRARGSTWALQYISVSFNFSLQHPTSVVPIEVLRACLADLKVEEFVELLRLLFAQ